jgi:flagellar FliJ protein
MELDKLDKVAMLARSEENRAAGTLHKSQQALDESAARLSQLEQFKREYEQRLEAIASSGIDARQLVDYRKFLHNLNDAINVQDKEIHRGESELELSREALVDRSLRRSTVDELISRGRVALQQEASKREQRHSDELTLQRHEPNS